MGATFSEIKQNLSSGCYFTAANQIIHNSAFGNVTTPLAQNEWHPCREAMGYLPSMITHAFCLIKDISIALFFLIRTIFIKLADIFYRLAHEDDSLSRRLILTQWLTKAAFCAVGIDLIGIFCPPVAYRLNEMAFKYFSDKDITNTVNEINDPFS